MTFMFHGQPNTDMNLAMSRNDDGTVKVFVVNDKGEQIVMPMGADPVAFDIPAHEFKKAADCLT